MRNPKLAHILVQLFEIVGNLTKTTVEKSSLEKYIFEKYKFSFTVSNLKFVSSLFQASKTIKK